MATEFLAPDEMTPATADYIGQLSEQLYLPRQTEHGCVTAAGAFAVNGVMRENIATASDIDEAVGRNPGEYVPTHKLAHWLLRRGFMVEKLVPYNPLLESLHQLAGGEMTIEEYRSRYEASFGKLHGRAAEIFEDHFLNSVVPAYLHEGELFGPYVDNGRYRKMEEPEITLNDLSGRIDARTYALAEVKMGGSGTTHVVSIFRPQPDQPAMLFSPARKKDSVLHQFDREWFDNMHNVGVEVHFISRP